MATGQINATQLALTPQQIQAMSPQDQAQFLNSLPANQRAVYQQEMANLGNMNFMRNSLRNVAFCPVTGGNGPTQNYSTGTTLFFDLPTTAGFAEALEIVYTVNFTLASGSTYGPTPAGKFALFNRVELDYNGPQIVSHPFFTSGIMPMLFGRQIKLQNEPAAGYVDSATNAVLVGGQPTIIGANTWQGRFRIHLNPLAKESPYGLLPLSGVGNRPQLKLTTPSALVGADPLNNILFNASGSGAASAISGTVQVNCIFKDGKNLQGVSPYQLANWQTMPTIQYYWESSLTPFNAGNSTINRFTIQNKFEHWYAVALVIDGQQSSSFISSLSNLFSFGLSPDFTAQQYFEAWNVANNISIQDYFQDRVRDTFLQDMPFEGIIPWVVGPARGINDVNNMNGAQFLNMYAEGFPATTHSYSVTNTGTTTTARVELFLVSKNRAGLKIS